MVAQDTQLFDTTIEENIIYGVDENNYEKEHMYHVCKLANAHEFISNFEDGYDTRVGERGVRLSGGQKQRIAIARMLMKKPKILFLDEATSSLDAESEALVQGAIDKMIWRKNKHKNKLLHESSLLNEEEEEEKHDNNKINNDFDYQANAVILVAHRLSTVVNADRICVLDKGQIAELGSHDELLKRNGIYAKLVSKQLQREQNRLNQDQNIADTSNLINNNNNNKSNQPLDSIDSLFDETEGVNNAQNTNKKKNVKST